MNPPLLQVEGLRVETVDGSRTLVNAVSFAVPRGAIVGLVGESGSGKSVTSLSILRLLPPKQVRAVAGRIVFAGQDLLTLAEEPMRALRGKRIAYVPQEPMSALNPTVRIGRQLVRVLQIHEGLDAGAARDRAAQTLLQMHMRDPDRILHSYPFELSGGQRQRVLLANAFMCRPELLIADEPTTALDVTVQAQVLATLRERAQDVGASVLLVTHNMGVVWSLCSHTIVMRQGMVVEQGDTKALFASPQAQYTRELLNALPERATPRQPIQVAG